MPKPIQDSLEKFIINDGQSIKEKESTIIKDLGKKWFGFPKMEILTPDEMVERINRG